MAKRQNKTYATMVEVDQILVRLDQQDKRLDKRLEDQDDMLKDISKVLKGSVALGLQGVVPMMNEMKASMTQICSDVAHLQRWKKREQESKGTFTIRTSVMITRILAVIGAAGVLIGAVLGGLQIIQTYKDIKKNNVENTK
jgi:hypothetical protein